ncbi:biotin-dependent carboxyltransferase family protein [Vibrio sp. ZSDZ34]|uniref:Biotin-dependent carboxyltransferase family protein n=1 Tax=Vibrio gelatinilyticus TaxID=2893468 RepID=A0A9X1WBQ4_9VIBR|nr:biotin-dependent carboxyltransferase family protein [Vibrio gelatinilyticus]MCJ2375690.1 biotin-dependent carboxyltransferase family protein [Vibrio gelatinilyticus]
MHGLVVLSPGMLATVQDLGRFGAAQWGLSQGGAADLHAHCWGQWLLEQPSSNASIEIVFGNARFQALDTLQLAITGADCNATLNGRALINWQSFTIRSGDIVEFGRPLSGLRSYLCIKGGLNISGCLGSCSTVIRNQLGGLDQGKPLKKGDILTPHTNSATNHLSSSKVIPRHYIPNYTSSQTLALLPAYQHSLFSACEWDNLLACEFQVSNNSDKMGIRLDYPSNINNHDMPFKRALPGIISEGICCGAVQIPPDGAPIIMMQDRQTLGGYAKCGSIAFRNLSKVAQLRPGDRVKFSLANLAVERARQRAFYQFFKL